MPLMLRMSKVVYSTKLYGILQQMYYIINVTAHYMRSTNKCIQTQFCTIFYFLHQTGFQTT